MCLQRRYVLDNDKIILRGCVLRNTQWCYGIVIFAGKDTKLMQNSGKSKFKRTSIDRLLNLLIIGIVLFLLSLCLFCMIGCGIWESLVGRYFQVNPILIRACDPFGALSLPLTLFTRCISISINYKFILYRSAVSFNNLLQGLYFLIPPSWKFNLFSFPNFPFKMTCL
jgi:magnesium-transporting ATPase (P-type)